MDEAQTLTIELLRYAITGAPLSKETEKSVDDAVLESVYEISAEQGVSSIVGSALTELGLANEEIKQAFFGFQLASIYNLERTEYELQKISELFENLEIKFIPLKGSVIRQYYPKPEMRESCDIDILIHKEDLDRACLALSEQLGYERRVSSPHDVGMFAPSGLELELHFSLYTAEDDIKEIVDKVWDYASVCPAFKFRCELTKEFFLFYHFVHMSKHIINGGCGVRPFMDLYVLDKNWQYDKNELYKMLSKAGLDSLADTAYKTAHAWFEDADGDQTTALLEDYIFSAGIYGNLENQTATSLARSGSKFKNLMQKIFLPYDKLKVIYPVLMERPSLTPLYEVKRWKRIIFRDKASHQIEIMKYNAKMDDDKRQSVTMLLENLGLK